MARFNEKEYTARMAALGYIRTEDGELDDFALYTDNPNRTQASYIAVNPETGNATTFRYDESGNQMIAGKNYSRNWSKRSLMKIAQWRPHRTLAALFEHPWGWGHDLPRGKKWRY